MAQKILLQMPGTNKLKPSAVGFSWTTFFFQYFVPLFRGDWSTFFCLFIIACVIAVPTLNIFYSSVGYGSQNTMMMTSVAGNIWYILQAIWGFVLSVGGGFFYNKIYTQKLIKKGWRPLRESDEQLLRQHNIKVPADYDIYTPTQQAE